MRCLFVASCLAVVGSVACAATSSSGGASSGSSGGEPPGTPSGAMLRNVDVTVIYPLPARDDLDALLAPSSIGKGGPLVGKDVFANGTVPELDEFASLPDDAARLAAMRVVALRYDPCAGVTMPPKEPASCVHQLRLLFQSLDTSAPPARARDGALHAFYRLDAAAAAEVEGRLRSLRAERLSDPEVPLGIHPRLAEEGLAGPYATALRELVLAHAGPENLLRVTTFARVANAFFDWRFAIRERGPAGFADGTVATIASGTQIVRTISGGRWDADLTPASGSPDDPTQVFKVKLDEQASAFKATARVLNPRKHTSESIDCGSCHLAPDIAVFVERTQKLSLDPGERFTTQYSVDATTKPVDDSFALKNLHMLSYLGETLNVSARSANETAAVLEYLNGQ